MVSADKRAKLVWNCRRGMLELDLILQRFVNNQMDLLNQAQLERFERLLAAQDPDLYAWLMGYETPVDKELREIVDYIRLHDNV